MNIVFKKKLKTSRDKIKGGGRQWIFMYRQQQVDNLKKLTEISKMAEKSSQHAEKWMCKGLCYFFIQHLSQVIKKSKRRKKNS